MAVAGASRDRNEEQQASPTGGAYQMALTHSLLHDLITQDTLAAISRLNKRAERLRMRIGLRV